MIYYDFRSGLTQKQCVDWMLSAFEHKAARVTWCVRTLERFHAGSSNAVYNIVSGDESWIYALIICLFKGEVTQAPVSDVISTITDSTTTSSTTPPENAVECGLQKRQTVPDFVKTRVNEADPGEFPWAVSLMIKKYQFGSNLKFSYTGTGSLIHDRVVLTAAHMLENKDLENLYAIVGEHDVFKKILPKKAMKVTEVVVHNKFVSSNGNYNFALAFLRSSATTNLPHVGTVCLPPAGFVASAGASCAFSGWGTDSAQKQIVQLTKTEVPMMTHSACEQKLKQLFGPRFKLHASFTCAGGEVGRDICTGGGGSPLVCPIEVSYIKYI
ncbi:hypothetical protein ABMA28_013020 [Loxostege sticticalis]|uniref:Peptidase S1 domain-containing protein n=1 Tax=Loxostege sticticalis TaxID=481309 RepID=A0ABD0S3C9_LOXSC